MPTIRDGIVRELADPKVRAIAQRVVREAELAAEKVAANGRQPAQFPLSPRRTSLEAILAERFRSLPEATQQAAGKAALGRLAAPAESRLTRFGDLASVDLRSPRAVDEQAEARPFPASLKVTRAYLQGLVEVHGQVLSGFKPQETLDRLQLRIRRVKCLNETNDVGDDEIALGGTSVDETGDTEGISTFRVANTFKTGSQRLFNPPRHFITFDLTEGIQFPKSYFVTLVLAEVDMGGLTGFVNKLLDWVKKKVNAALVAAIGGAIGVSGGPIGAVIGAVVGYVVGAVFDWFRSIWSDDVFKPQTVSLGIPSLPARWDGGRTESPERTVSYIGHGGKYELAYDWKLAALDVPDPGGGGGDPKPPGTDPPSV